MKEEEKKKEEFISKIDSYFEYELNIYTYLQELYQKKQTKN